MLRNLNKSSGGRRVLGTPNVGLIASQIISETATGDSGAGLLYDEALSHSGQQLRVKITSWDGTPGALTVLENGSVLIEGQSDGNYVIGYEWESYASNGDLLSGSDTASVAIGITAASLSGTSDSVVSAVSSLSSGIKIVASCASSSVASAILKSGISLTSVAIARCVASASLAGTASSLVGALLSSSSSTSSLLTLIKLTSSAASYVAATGILTSDIKLAAVASAVASGSADIVTGIKLNAEISAVVTCVASLIGMKILDATIISISTVSGALTTDIRLSGSSVSSSLALAAFSFTGITAKFELPGEFTVLVSDEFTYAPGYIPTTII